jgi:hypothetical protein
VRCDTVDLYVVCTCLHHPHTEMLKLNLIYQCVLAILSTNLSMHDNFQPACSHPIAHTTLATTIRATPGDKPGHAMSRPAQRCPINVPFSHGCDMHFVRFCVVIVLVYAPVRWGCVSNPNLVNNWLLRVGTLTCNVSTFASFESVWFSGVVALPNALHLPTLMIISI